MGELLGQVPAFAIIILKYGGLEITRPYSLGGGPFPPCVRRNSNGRLRYSWVVDLDSADLR